MEGEQRVIGGRYELRELLGSGGMADVFRAVDRRLGRDVAVKMLLPAYACDPEFVERFRREARAAAALNHPNVVAVYDWGSHEGTYFMVMEFVPGPTLKDTIRARGPLPENEAIMIIEQAASGLQAAHEHGLVHRDVKPHNILLAPDGRVKVADFGIAYAAGATQLTATNAVSGTAMYMSPEQAQLQRVDSRSDVYSLGVVFYETLVGVAPYREGSIIEIAMQHVNAPIPNVRSYRPDLRLETVAVLERALNKSPSARYDNAGDMRAALSKATHPPTADTPSPYAPALLEKSERTIVHPVAANSSAPAPMRHERKRGWHGAVLAVPLLIAALVSGIALAVLHPGQSKSSGGILGPSTATSAPTPRAARTVRHHSRTKPASHAAMPSPTITAAVAPPALAPIATNVPGGVAIGGSLGPEQTVQAFYADILQRNFAAAAALWTPNMRNACDPAQCINQRFASTTAVQVHAHMSAPPQDGQATVSVILEEVANNERHHYVGHWNLVQHGGGWLMDGESFCQPGIDAACPGN